MLLIEAFGSDNRFWIYAQVIYRLLETVYLSIVILLLWSPRGKSKLSDETTSTVGTKKRSGEVDLPVVNDTEQKQ